MKRRIATLVILFVFLIPMFAAAVPAQAAVPGDVFINEIHYDNSGTDTGEAVEIAGPAGTDLTGWSIALYNGNGGAQYGTINLGGTIPDQQNGFGTLHFPHAGIQNGSPDGLALVDSGNMVLQFLSYEGTLIAVGGPADGMESTDIGVSQPWDTPVGDSLQLSGTGAVYEDFNWNPNAPNTFASINTGQTFEGTPPENAPIIPNCGSPLSVIEGNSASQMVSASDEDSIVTNINLDDVDPPSSDISLTNVTPATEVGGTATATVEVAATTSPDSYDVTIGFANDDTVPQTAQCTFEVEVIQIVPIYDIQGPGQFSPFEGQVVATTGVVTLFTANGANFWLQDVDGDGNPATSDGIFAAGGGYPDIGPRPAVGDQIRIVASVDEQQFGNALPLTRLRNVGFIEIISSGNPLLEPVSLSDLPDESIAEGIAFWEPLEGMLVSVENAPVVAATSGFGEFAMLTKDDAKPGSGFYPETEQILIRSLGDNEVDYNPERVLVDDSSLAEAINVMPGDRVRSLVGVVDYTFGNYKLQPESFDVKTHNLPNLPASTRDGSFGDTAITTFNVENLFDLVLNTPTTVDAFGEVGFDPGSYWGPPNTQNNTLRRKPEVCQGDLIETDPFDPSLEWDGFGEDNFDDLGSHAVNCGTAAGLFISEYVEGSSNNKALEIFNGTGAAVNLSASGYAIDIYFNGNTSPYTTILLAGTLEPGEVFVVADIDADPAILAVADQISTASFFNGDDAVVLRQGGKDDASSTPTPEELEIQLTKLALAIQIELDLPEIIVVQEVENTEILQELGDLVNEANGTSYMAVSFETSDGRGIEAGFLWDAARVTLLEAYQLTDDIVPGVSDAFGPTSASPGREPIVGVFDIEGLETTIVGNHFKSKGGDDPLFGINWPPIRGTEVQRKLQAQVVRDFVNTILEDDPTALVMVAGDLNDFQFGEPGEGSDHPIAILEGDEDEVPLLNLVNLEKEPERFTYVFDGNSQVLDHMLISPGLYSLYVAVDVLHFNASYPAYLGADASTPIRSSDHDALEGRFVFAK